ncbi:unnamed protein product [Prunus armeniaca]
MSTAKASNKKCRTEPQLAKSDHLDLDLSKCLYQNEQPMNIGHVDQTRAMGAFGIYLRSNLLNPYLLKHRRAFGRYHTGALGLTVHLLSYRQSFAKSLSKSSKEVCGRRRKECENCLKTETAKFQAQYLQALKGKKERSLISEHEKACTDKIAKLEESLKKKKQAVEAFAKEDHDRANKLLEQAPEMDEESKEMILRTRNVETQGEIVLGLQEHGAKEAMCLCLLKCQISSFSGISSIMCLKVIIETQEEEISKGSRRRILVLKLLQEKSIKWTEGENAGTILI